MYVQMIYRDMYMNSGIGAKWIHILSRSAGRHWTQRRMQAQTQAASINMQIGIHPKTYRVPRSISMPWDELARLGVILAHVFGFGVSSFI